ncbi:ImmA/IrrE family metallo-endopeptidase [Caldalkalibacillus uzonensis]|uniref:ImmA/IrrE family metallo-endopeptidase n=1 Tax=Caldalkalibacillus uzonensis TaxID=353224 RepID=UPI003521924B
MNVCLKNQWSLIERKIFSVVHELGHLIFHRNQYCKDTENLVYANYQKVYQATTEAKR